MLVSNFVTVLHFTIVSCIIAFALITLMKCLLIVVDQPGDSEASFV